MRALFPHESGVGSYQLAVASQQASLSHRSSFVVHRSASLYRTQDQQDWVLITLTRQERECAERARLALCRALAGYLATGVTIGVLTGKLLVYLDGRGIADHRQASVAMLRVRAGLALHYGLGNPRHPLELSAALANDFAWGYIEKEE